MGRYDDTVMRDCNKFVFGGNKLISSCKWNLEANIHIKFLWKRTSDIHVFLMTSAKVHLKNTNY